MARMEGDNEGRHKETIEDRVWNKVSIGEVVHCPMTRRDNEKRKKKRKKEKGVESFMTNYRAKRSSSSNLTFLTSRLRGGRRGVGGGI